MAAPRLTALRYYYCDVSGSNWFLFPNSPGRNLYAALIRRGAKKCLHLLPTVFLRNSTERVDPPLPFVLATYPKVSSPRAPRRRQRKQPACSGGAAFFFTIRPGRLSLPSVAYEFTSIPGWVQFPFDFSLVAVTRIRASVSTPPKLTLRGIHSREQTQPLHTPRSTPSCISIQDPSRRVEVLRGTHYSEYPPQKRCVCQVRFVLVGLGGFDQKCYAYAQDYPSSRKLRGDWTTLRRTTARRGFTAQGPCRGKALSQRIEDAQLRTT
ncbi:hypothetical protein VNO78_35168 [Psophocarpus tetragonolobus]|uniref:Uncharacterized protein n=1 Tax=Psophocarpus tetragonolobus TaxID=3891 RepID=A0AAN9NMG9_PSOTE